MTTTTLHPEFDVETSTHSYCRHCVAAANLAAGLAKATGSNGASHTIERARGVEHSATVKRVRCLSGRSDCSCPLCSKLARFQPADPFEDL